MISSQSTSYMCFKALISVMIHTVCMHHCCLSKAPAPLDCLHIWITAVLFWEIFTDLAEIKKIQPSETVFTML